MIATLGKNVISCITVKRWVAEFKRGRQWLRSWRVCRYCNPGYGQQSPWRCFDQQTRYRKIQCMYSQCSWHFTGKHTFHSDRGTCDASVLSALNAKTWHLSEVLQAHFVECWSKHFRGRSCKLHLLSWMNREFIILHLRLCIVAHCSPRPPRKAKKNLHHQLEKLCTWFSKMLMLLWW
jgi:hypothetical protein